MNMTQANPYCFEFKFNRMNPLNLTNEDFGEIQIFSSTYRRDPQQRSREFFRQFKLTQIATIMPNETYVSFVKLKLVQVNVRCLVEKCRSQIENGRCNNSEALLTPIF